MALTRTAYRFLSLSPERTKHALTDRYMLMRMACEITAEAGEVAGALDVVDRMQEFHEVDATAAKAYVMPPSLLDQVPRRSNSS